MNQIYKLGNCNRMALLITLKLFVLNVGYCELTKSNELISINENIGQKLVLNDIPKTDQIESNFQEIFEEFNDETRRLGKKGNKKGGHKTYRGMNNYRFQPNYNRIFEQERQYKARQHQRPRTNKNLLPPLESDLARHNYYEMYYDDYYLLGLDNSKKSSKDQKYDSSDYTSPDHQSPDYYDDYYYSSKKSSSSKKESSYYDDYYYSSKKSSSSNKGSSYYDDYYYSSKKSSSSKKASSYYDENYYSSKSSKASKQPMIMDDIFTDDVFTQDDLFNIDDAFYDTEYSSESKKGKKNRGKSSKKGSKKGSKKSSKSSKVSPTVSYQPSILYPTFSPINDNTTALPSISTEPTLAVNSSTT